ncbi:MAG: hypothetical protein HYV26_20510, partial [Candidatus Hydrogenedentes bacterium]|nr:hypothetical protein [Candidatus Hydrogenedentota bacterium]
MGEGYAAVVEGRLIRVLDISNPANPVPVGSLPHVADAKVLWDGPFLYARSGSALKVFEAGIPNTPVEVATLTAISGFGGELEIMDGFLYGSGTIIDVRDPFHPVAAGFMTSSVDDIDVDGRFAYAISDGGLKIVDISDPGSAFVVSSLPRSAFSNQTTTSVCKLDSLLFVGSYGGLLHVVDVSNASSPVIISSTDVGSYFFYDLVTLGDYLYGADPSAGIVVADISFPGTPTWISNIGTPGEAVQLSLLGSTLYLTDVAGGLRLYDLANPALPVLLGSYVPTASNRQSAATPVAHSGQNVFCVWADGDSDARFSSISIADPVQPVEVGSVPVPGNVSQFIPSNLVVQGTSAYAANMAGFSVWDISDPDSPQEVGSIGPSGYDLVVQGNYAYVVSSSLGPFAILDIHDPLDITVVSVLNVNGAPGVAVHDEYAYMGGVSTFPFSVIDVSDPQQPTVVGTISTVNAASDVAVSGGFAYVVEYNTNRFWVIDVSNPSNPLHAAELSQAAGYNAQIVAADRYAYVAGSPFSVIDITNPTSPQVVATTQTGVGNVAIGRHAFVSDRFGISVIAIPPPAPLVDPLPRYINADAILLMGTADPGSFVTIGGGLTPVFQQLAPGAVDFSIVVPLKQEAVNTLSVTTMDGYGLVSLPTIRRVVEGDAFPATIETVTALAITPDPPPAVGLLGVLAFSCLATFSDASQADVTLFVTWEETANNETVTPGGLYVNTAAGAASVRASDAGVLSNAVAVADGARLESGGGSLEEEAAARAAVGVVAGQVTDQLTGLGLGLPQAEASVNVFAPLSSTMVAQQPVLQATGAYAFTVNSGAYDLEGTSPGYRAEEHAAQGVPPIPQRLAQNFALRREDDEPPVVTLIEPADGLALGAPEVQISAIVFDRLSELAEAQLIVNGNSFPIRVEEPEPAVSHEGFYRNVWPVSVGATTIQIRAVDTEGNEGLSALVTLNSGGTPFEIEQADAVTGTSVSLRFNRATGDVRALQIARYEIKDGTTPLAVTAVTRLADDEVLLTTAAQTAGTTYTLRAHGIRDTFGVALRANKTLDFTGTAALPGDTDADGLVDAWETAHGLTVGVNDSAGDP